jgi:hypothetical protein
MKTMLAVADEWLAAERERLAASGETVHTGHPAHIVEWLLDELRARTLTDAEREAIEKAIGRELDAEWYGGEEPDRVVALRGLLGRTK